MRWIALILLTAAPAAFAAHPLQTEDTATQGAGNVEVETGWSRARSGGMTVRQAQLQLSYGLTAALDLLLQPSWLASRSSDGSGLRGIGDTNLDAKWRWYGDAPWSLALRGGVAVATSRQGLGLPHDTVSPHMLLVTTVEDVPFTLHANVGVGRLPAAAGARRNLGHVSGALMWAASERLTLTAEATTDTDPDAARQSWTKSALVGIIYTVRPGLDVDAGWLTTLRGPAARTWLLGVTFRFAP